MKHVAGRSSLREAIVTLCGDADLAVAKAAMRSLGFLAVFRLLIEGGLSAVRVLTALHSRLYPGSGPIVGWREEISLFDAIREEAETCSKPQVVHDGLLTFVMKAITRPGTMAPKVVMSHLPATPHLLLSLVAHLIRPSLFPPATRCVISSSNLEMTR